MESFDQLLQGIVTLLLTVLLLGWLMRNFKQPYFIAYIIAGILLGPGGIRLFKDVELISQIGALGLVLQMFFIGTEIEVPELMKNAKVLFIGAAVQLLLSCALIAIIGSKFGWSATTVILFGFIISLSSSAIILEYLHKNKEIDTRLGTITTGILIVQDFLIVPMVMTLNFLAKEKSEWNKLLFGVLVAVIFIVLLRRLVLNKRVRWPQFVHKAMDHELQLFFGLLICFGFAWITNLLNLSAALGAMFAGIVISRTNSTQWLGQSLVPFRIFFLCIFFFSIGLQINTAFIHEHLLLIMSLVIGILAINSGINTVVFRVLKESWENSLYAGALLSQIGEFSLVLCTVARALQLVDDFYFQLTLAVISLTMLFSSTWIGIIRTVVYQHEPTMFVGNRDE